MPGDTLFTAAIKPKEIDVANRQQRSNREAKKPKKEKIKVSAAPSQKASAWQPTLASGKKNSWPRLMQCREGRLVASAPAALHDSCCNRLDPPPREAAALLKTGSALI